jgi:Activator of Hsp90 ATPase, N-terminal
MRNSFQDNKLSLPLIYAYPFELLPLLFCMDTHNSIRSLKYSEISSILRKQLPVYSDLPSKMVLHNPNNWHWVNKDASEWAKAYLAQSLTQISAEKGDVSAKVTKVISVDGDVDVSQRKGKVITLFDVKLQLEYEGGSDGSKKHWAGSSSIAGR